MSPDGDGTFTVPAATDCTDDGAICTHDDTMLSSQPVLTIRAPSQEAASNAGGAIALSGVWRVPSSVRCRCA